MSLFVCRDSLLELLLSNITPRADGVGNNGNIKFGHSGQRRFEHQIVREDEEKEDEDRENKHNHYIYCEEKQHMMHQKRQGLE